MNNSFGLSCGNTVGRSDYVGRNSSTYFPQPFLDYTATAVPRTFSELLDWSEYMYLWSPEIREINKRLVNYFNTDVEVSAVDSGRQALGSDENRDWTRIITDELQWNVHAINMLDNVSVYGNDFISVVAPHRRFLRCPRCRREIELESLAENPKTDFARRDGEFVARCLSPVCSREAPEIRKMEVRDMRVRDPDKLKIKHWPVREIVMDFYELTDSTRVYWKIPEHYRRAIKFGDPKTLAEADPAILEAVEKDKLFRFKDDRVFHAKEPVLSGIRTRGWGIPRNIYMSRQAWTLQLLRKQIQALGIDFVTPIRLLTPANRAVAGGQTGVMINPSQSMSHDEFNRLVSSIRRRHRKDPTEIFSLQVPVEYSVLGGEASQLFPADLHNIAREDLLDAGGFPIDIYKANLTVQAAPVGLRLFESQNRHIPMMLNSALHFVVNRVSELAGRDPVVAKHQRVTLVDNIETSMMRVNMAMQGAASMTNAMKTVNMNYEDEVRQTIRDQALMEDLQRERQEELSKQEGSKQQIQQMSQPVDPNTGQPAQGGGGMPMDPLAGRLPSTGLVLPQDLMGLESAVSALAQQLSQMDPMSRQNEISVLRQSNPSAHGLLMTRLEQADRQNAQMGRQMMLSGGM